MAEDNSMSVGDVSRELIHFARQLKHFDLLETVKEISITHQVNNLYETVTLKFQHEKEVAIMSYDEGEAKK